MAKTVLLGNEKEQKDKAKKKAAKERKNRAGEVLFAGSRI